MEIPSSQWKGLERRLAARDLSLEDLRSIEDEISFLSTDEKMQKMGRKIFSQMEKKRGRLIEKQMGELSSGDLNARMKKLKLSIPQLSLEETESAMERLQQEISLETGDYRNWLEVLSFMKDQPLVQELDLEALSSNFASRMKHLARVIVEQGSLGVLKELNLVQQREVLRYAQGDGL